MVETIITGDQAYHKIKGFYNEDVSSYKEKWNAWVKENQHIVGIDFSEYHFNNNTWIISSDHDGEYLDFKCLLFPTISFKQATFEGEVRFTRATFKGLAFFSQAEFHDGGSFFEVQFDDTIYFNNITLCKGNMVFALSSFKGALILQGTHFTWVPDFAFTHFEKTINLHDVIIPDRPPKEQKLYHEKQKIRNNMVARYRHLKMMAIKAEDQERKLNFFAGEMRAKIGSETKTLPGKLLNYSYGFFSNYGRSLWRPLFAIGATWCVFSILIYLFAHDSTCHIDDVLQKLTYAFDLSRHSLIPNIFASHAKANLIKQLFYHDYYNFWLNTLLALETLLGTLFLFFMILALRNKFLMK